MVQALEAIEIRKRWEAAGSPPCDHKKVSKEYYLGAQTGDKICMDCGETNPEHPSQSSA